MSPSRCYTPYYRASTQKQRTSELGFNACAHSSWSSMESGRVTQSRHCHQQAPGPAHVRGRRKRATLSVEDGDLSIWLVGQG
jgi:hypothetical protein